MPLIESMCNGHTKKPTNDKKNKCLESLIQKKTLEEDQLLHNSQNCPPCRTIYTWFSAPKTIQNAKKSQIRNQSTTTTTTLVQNKDVQQQNQSYKNLMYDKRIIRGSNYCQTQFAAPWNPYFAYAGLLSGKGDTDYSNVKESERRRHLIKKRQIQAKNSRNVIGTPPPVYGRKHENVQTEKYLEELYERPPAHDASVQTELFLQRPPTPPYVVSKTGIDAQTEILDGELFDFDVEVQPLLETIVNHTIEQSLLEVMHEEEIEDLKKKQQEFLAQREAELTELRRLEAEEIRLQAEKERRRQQEEIAKQLDAEVQERVTAAKLLQGYIANILPGVLSQIEPLLEASDRTNLEKELCPWLTKEVAEEVGHIIDSREILTEIIKEILVERASKYLDIPEESEEEEKEEIQGEEEIKTPTTERAHSEMEENGDIDQDDQIITQDEQKDTELKTTEIIGDGNQVNVNETGNIEKDEEKIKNNGDTNNEKNKHLENIGGAGDAKPMTIEKDISISTSSTEEIIEVVKNIDPTTIEKPNELQQDIQTIKNAENVENNLKNKENEKITVDESIKVVETTKNVENNENVEMTDENEKLSIDESMKVVETPEIVQSTDPANIENVQPEQTDDTKVTEAVTEEPKETPENSNDPESKSNY